MIVLSYPSSVNYCLSWSNHEIIVWATMSQHNPITTPLLSCFQKKRRFRMLSWISQLEPLLCCQTKIKYWLRLHWDTAPVVKQEADVYFWHPCDCQTIYFWQWKGRASGCWPKRKILHAFCQTKTAHGHLTICVLQPERPHAILGTSQSNTARLTQPPSDPAAGDTGHPWPVLQRQNGTEWTCLFRLPACGLHNGVTETQKKEFTTISGTVLLSLWVNHLNLARWMPPSLSECLNEFHKHP